MKMFIWRDDILTDYTDGIAVAVCDDVDQARKMILEKYRQEKDEKLKADTLADEDDIEASNEEVEDMRVALTKDPGEVLELPNCVYLHGGS